MKRSPLERLMARVEVVDDCWIWQGYRTPLGYGRIGMPGGPQLAHRVSYELHLGPMPDGFVTDHLCRNPSCVNPDHLEAVTQAENMKRGDVRAATVKRHAAQTHCKRGHEFTQDNTRVSAGRRVCRACANDRAVNYYHRQKAA